MRHGQAQEYAESDSQRALIEEGELETRVVAKFLNKEVKEADLLLVSPYLRAQQTAASLVDAMSLSVKQQTLDLLVPAGNALEVHDYLDGLLNVEKIQNVIIVSHMPLVSYLVSELTVSNDMPIFQTAAIAEIDYDVKKMKGQLLRMITTEDIC